MSTSSVSSGSGSLIPFNGSSTYSADFQTVLNNAVNSASQPMIALQGDVTTLQSQQSALATLDTTFISLQSAISSVSAAVGGAPNASTSSSAVSATADSTALSGSYSIQVDNLGSSTTALSNSGLTTVTDPTTGNISSSTNYTLTVNGVADSITSSGTSLEDLVSAINASGDGVQSTIVNVGSTQSPDYRLSVTSDNLAPDTIQLNDGTQNLLSTLSTGTNAQYSVNGQTSTISSNSDNVTLSPGLTVQLTQTTTSPVTVTVSQSFSGLETALSNLSSAYNSAVNALAANRGEAGGALTGDQIVYQLTDVLNSLATYSTGTYSTTAGSVNSLSDLGLSVDETGQMSFDSTTYSEANSASIQQFLGTTTTGGFLETANNNLQTMTDPNTGLLQGESNTLQTEVTTNNNEIADDQTRISDLTTNLQSELSAADAAIASLQSQNTYFQELFQATYGTNGTSTAG